MIRDPGPLDPLYDAGHALLAAAITNVAVGARPRVLLTDTQAAAYRKHIKPGTTGTMLADLTAGTHIVREDPAP